MTILEVLLRARNELSPAIKTATKDLKSLENAAGSAGGRISSSLGKLGEHFDRAGTSARFALGGISQLAGGSETALGRATGQAAQYADAIGDIGGALSKLGIAGVALGGVSLILAEWGAIADQNSRRIADSVKPFDQIAARLREMDQATPLSNLADSIDTSTKNLDALIQSSRGAREEVLRWVEAERELAALREKAAIINQAQQDTYGLLNRAATEGLKLGDIKTFYDGLFSALQNGVGITGDFAGAMEEVSAKQAEWSERSKEARDELAATNAKLAEQNVVLEANKTRWDALNGVLLNYANNTSAAALTTERWNQYNTRVANSLGETDRSLEKNGQSLEEYNAKWKRAAEDGLRKGEAAVARLKSALSSLVSSALQSTQVTDADMAAAALGKYVDKWDELARQADDVAITPENISKYADLAKALDQTGMSAEQFAKSFRDMSLFANPQNLNLVNWDAFTESIKVKIRGMIGEANLMKEAFRQALSSLSPQELQQFTKALDLDPSAAGNVDKMFAAFSGQEADETKNTLGNMANNLSVIEGTHTSTLTFVWEKAKTAIEEAHDFISEKILQYADVLIEITARFTAPTPPPNGGGGSGGSTPPSKARGGYVGRGLYELGEKGEEFVLPHGMVKYIEGVLGGRISNPDQIGWLIESLRKGPAEASWALQNWASGMAGWGVDGPEKSGKWLDKVYDRYASKHGVEAVPEAARSSAGGSAGAGAGGGGTIINVSLIDMDAGKLAEAIVKALKPHLIDLNEKALIDRLARAISRQLGGNANRRAAGRI